MDGSMNDLLRVWPIKRGSQSLALASRAALVLLFLIQLLCARPDAQAPHATVRINSATETLGNRSHFGKFWLSSESMTSQARDYEKGHILSPYAVSMPSLPFPTFSFFSPFLYHQLPSCTRVAAPSSSPSVSKTVVRKRGRSSPEPSRRNLSDSRSDTRSALLNFISAPFPSLILASATRVRLGTGHTHHMKHGATSGVLQPGDSNSTGEEESDEEEDTVLTQEEQAEEDECAAQSAVQAMLEGDFSGDSTSLMATSQQWLKLKDVLLRRMTNKELCAASRGSEQVCRVPAAKDSGGGETFGGSMPCGGEKYERLIEKFLDDRNCLAAMAMSHTLSQGWLGLPHADEAASVTTGGAETSLTAEPVQDKAEHSLALAARGGLLGILIRQYQQVIDSGVLDSALSSAYSAAAQLLTDFKAAAVEGLNAFNSLELRDALQLRRTQQVAILCSLGEGKKAELGSSVLSGDNTLIVRVNTDGHDQATVKAFIDAVSAFSKFVKALLEEGGFADRAIEVHKDFYKFRFEKMQALMQEVEPSTVVHTSNALLNALPLEKHKKHKKKGKSHGHSQEGGAEDSRDQSSSSSGNAEQGSFPQFSATESRTLLPGTFLQLVAEQRDAFNQHSGSFHVGNDAGSRSGTPASSLLQQGAELGTSQLLQVPLLYGTPTTYTTPQQPSTFFSAPLPPTLVATPAVGTAAAQGGVAAGQQQVAVGSSAPAQLSGMQQPGGIPAQAANAGAAGAVVPQWTATQPSSPTMYAAGPQQQQPQQQLRQLPVPLQGTLQQASQATPQLQLQLQQPLQQQPLQQQPLQQQPLQQQPLQQTQQQPQQQSQPALGQPFVQAPGPYNQHDQQQGQPLQQQQQLQGQSQMPMQPAGYAGGSTHSPQDLQAQQPGEGQHVAGGAPGALGQGEGAEEGKARQGHRGGGGPGHGDFASHAFTEKGVPLKQKIKAVMSRLRMFKMEKDDVLFEPDEPAIDKIVRAGYLEPSDRVFIAWGSLLPQAAVTTAAELLTMMLPIPEVDLALFYNKTLHEGGQLTDGYDGPLPVDDKMITERFSRFIDETYRECWRIFFAKNDNLVGEAMPPSPPTSSSAQPQQQPWNTGVAPNAAVSALQLSAGAGRGLSLAAEIEELTKASRSVTRAAAASLHEQQQQQQPHLVQFSRAGTQAKTGDGVAPAVALHLKKIAAHEEDAAALAQVHQHASAQQQQPEGATQTSGGKARVTVTFVESSDGLSVEDMQKKFLNEVVVSAKTAKVMSGAASTIHMTVLPAAASAAMALFFALFFVDH